MTKAPDRLLKLLASEERFWGAEAIGKKAGINYKNISNAITALRNKGHEIEVQKYSAGHGVKTLYKLRKVAESGQRK